MGLRGKAVNERGIAQDIDDPRDTATLFRDHGDRLVSEDLPSCPRGSEAAFNVPGDLLFLERLQVKVDCYALRELLQYRIAQLLPKLWLAYQDELQNRRFRGVDIRQHSQELERLEGKILGLVDHK